MSVSTRRKVDLDYEILHRTGERVPKVRPSKMASNEQLQIQAINICSDVEDLWESYQVDDLTDGEELSQFVIKIGDMKREFRRVHAQLKSVEGNDFDKNHPDYKKHLDKLNEQFKNANNKLSVLSKADKLKMEETGKIQGKSERKFFMEQAYWELADCDWNYIAEADEIKLRISKFESNLEKICKNRDNVKLLLRDPHYPPSNISTTFAPTPSTEISLLG